MNTTKNQNLGGFVVVVVVGGGKGAGVGRRGVGGGVRSKVKLWTLIG